MLSYVLKRLALMIPTLGLILALNFVIVHLAPTGPIHTELAKIDEQRRELSWGMGAFGGGVRYQGAEGLSDEMVGELSARFGFDKPAHERFYAMIKDYLRFELGTSFFKGQTVFELIKDKLSVSLMFGGLCLFVMYGMGIGIGVAKAATNGRLFDKLSTVVLSVLYALPSFVVGVGLLVLFAGGRFWQIFPMQVSFGVGQLPFFEKVGVALYQLFLPVMASALAGVAGVAYLTKFSLLDEQTKPYVKLMGAYGITQAQFVKNGTLKNALLPVVADMPMAVVGLLFFGNFIMEVIFGIDGLGRLGHEAMLSRDYPVMFGLLYVFGLMAMVVQLVFDVWYRCLDPRVVYR